MGLIKTTESKREFYATRKARTNNVWVVYFLKYDHDQKGKLRKTANKMEVVAKTLAHAKRVFFSNVKGRVIQILREEPANG